MTKKIYENDSYINEQIATVKDVVEIDGETWVRFDQTIFYPEGGGQPCDLGTIDQVRVVDVQTFQGGIFHKVDKPIERSRVKLSIDFSRRFDHMQQHTGQHLLSAVWQELFGYKTISFHLGKDICTIDLQTNSITEDQIAAVEKKVSQYIFENRTVESYILPYDEVEESFMMKLKEKPAFVRFIEIECIDQSTCCGTHVTMLGEIGLMKIIGWEKYKQNVRLTFIAGLRAFQYLQTIFEHTNAMSKKLHVSPLHLHNRFIQFYEEHQELKKAYKNLYDKDIHHEANSIVSTNDFLIELHWENRPIQELKDLAKVIIEKDNKAVLLQNVAQQTWIFASTSSSVFNVSKWIMQLKAEFGGKGGGNPVFGQWTGEIENHRWQKLKSDYFS